MSTAVSAVNCLVVLLSINLLTVIVVAFEHMKCVCTIIPKVIKKTHISNIEIKEN